VLLFTLSSSEFCENFKFDDVSAIDASSISFSQISESFGKNQETESMWGNWIQMAPKVAPLPWWWVKLLAKIGFEQTLHFTTTISSSIGVAPYVFISLDRNGLYEGDEAVSLSAMAG
jgi:hypothetical protein